ncbi:MAG: hypothetical protein LT102_13450 [Burkholderiaceae bacterium]|nr:hypothetical protein [Burkholderiaceae bacterium]
MSGIEQASPSRETDGFVDVPLHRVAHARAGDKGDRLNVSVIAYRAECYPLLCEQLSAERVARRFAHRSPGVVRRYELPRLWALNFVVDDVLEGGVNDALNLDGHGKTHSYLVLSMTVRVPRELLDPTKEEPER